jgi:uncharacterized protein (TIGR03067 family)
MKRFGLFCLSVAMIVVCNSVADEKEAKFDAAKLEGKWKITSGTKLGEKSDEKATAGMIVFKKDKIEILEGEQVAFVISYKLDTKATPIGIDMKILEGPAGKDSETEGIIELKGDELKLCYGMPGEKRPTKFESPKDGKLLYFVMKKDK